MKVNVNYDEVNDLVNKIAEYDNKCYTALVASSKISAKDLENKAKKNAKWTDRTGQARKSISGEGDREGDNIVITLEGYATQDDKEYFQYLELYHKKKNAILYPTIKDNTDDVLRSFSQVLSKIKL